MPDRYWVGGTASWDGTAGTKWATTSGGTGGASVPTSADDVFFDALSGGTSVVTIAAGNTGARSINCTGFLGTLTGSANITVSGSVTLSVGMTYSHTGTVTFNGTGTLTTAGKSFSNVVVDGAGITLTLGDALNASNRNVTVTQGTLTTAGFSITCNNFSSNNSNTRTINLGASTLSLGFGAFFTTTTNLTLNAGTSLISINFATGSLDGGPGLTFHNVAYTSTAGSSSGIRTLLGANTMNNLTLSAPTLGMSELSISGNQTINGTLTCAGISAIRRCFLRSNTIGTTRTLTAAAISAADCDFRDITLAGAAAGAAPTRAGDCGGNSGITFPAAKNCFRVGSSTEWQGVNSWALTSGGAGSDNNFPLAQDTAVIDNSATPSGDLFYNFYNISAVDTSARTNALTINHSNSPVRYGSYTFGSGVTIAGTAAQVFSGRGVMTLTTAGKTLTFSPIADTPTGTLRLLDALTLNLGTFGNLSLTRGTLDLNGFTLSIAANSSSGFSSSNSNTRTIAFGTGNMTIAGVGTLWDTNTATNLTVTGTPEVNITNATSTGVTINSGSAAEGGAVNFNFTAGTYTITFGTFTNVRNLNFTGFAGTFSVPLIFSLFGNLTFSTGMTVGSGTNTFTFASTSATARTITTNGKTLDFPVTFNGVGGTFRLLDNMTVGATRTTTLTAGTLDLNGFVLSSGSFNSNGSTARTLAFGSSSISVTGTGTVWNTGTVTNMTVTGTPVVNVTNNTATATTVSPGSPTEANSISFNFTAGTYSLSLGFGAVRNLNFTGFAGTLDNQGRSIFGNLVLSTGMTLTAGANVQTFASTSGTTRTITSNGRTMDFPITFNGAGGSWQLQDALNISGRALTVTQGTFSTGGFNVTAGSLVSQNAAVRTIQLSSSTITLSGSGRAMDFRFAGNLTFTAGTSQINITSNSTSIDIPVDITFHNFSFTSSLAGTRSLTNTGVKTFNNLTLVASAAGFSQLTPSTNLIVNGTFTCAGSSATARGFVASDTLGTVRTITAAAISASDCDFRDITLAGAAAGAAPTRAGDCGGNSGITFPAAKTVYRVGTNTTWAGSSSWALMSNGTGADNNFPLAQDTAVIDNNTALTGTLSLADYNISALDCSTRTTGITLDHSSFVTRYGSYILGSGVTVSGTANQTFSGRGVTGFNSAGKTITFQFTINAPGGTFRLLNAPTISNQISLNTGTLDLNNFTLTVTAVNQSSGTRTLAFGTGNITVTGTGTVWSSVSNDSLTVTGTPVVNVTNSTSTATTVSAVGTAIEAASVSFNFTAGTYSLSLTGSVRNLNFTGFAGTLTNGTRTVFGDLTISTGMTLTAGTLVQTFASTSGTARTIRTNGKTLDFPLAFNGVGGTTRLLDALTMGSTRQLTHTNGTLDLNGFNLTVGTAYTTATGIKNLTFNGGTLTCPAATTTAFNNAQPTDFTTTAGTGTGTINMTAATAKTFVGGGSTFNCTLNNGGAGALTVTGSNTFTTLANSVQPTSFLFTAGTTQTVTNWNIVGTAGNLVTIGSPTAAQHTLSKASGTVNADYLSISRSTATGGAVWVAGANSVDGGNNTGWIFGAAPPPGGGGSFLMLMS